MKNQPMKEKIDYYDEVLKLLQTLKIEYPQYEISKHMATATSDYQDIWGLTDRQLYDLLDKYQFELSCDSKHLTPESELDKIIKEGMNLSNILDEEDENY